MDKLAVYIHWPYCARICPYCDFNVYKRRDDDVLIPAILTDLAAWRETSGPREISSIHFGGGTPSLMSPSQVGTVIDKVDQLWGIGGGVEIALEANPHEMNEDDWHGYRMAGLSRMSLGVQSFNNEALQFLGRDHDGNTARTALSLAMGIFPSVSADLIFGWARQTKNMLDKDLAILLASDVQHISTYQLTIEDGTAFAKAEGRGQVRAVDADLSADLYDHVRSQLGLNGFAHYEVSNFAKPGHQSQHNLAYWRGIDYVGVGPGAHGRITVDGERFATIAHLTPKAYTSAVSDSASGIDSHETLSHTDWAAEYLLMGLRIQDGISLSRYEALAGAALNASEVNHYIEEGLIARTGDNLRATNEGRLVLNRIIEKLLLA